MFIYSKRYQDKHKDDKENFHAKERYIVVGRKKLSFGSLERPSLKMSTLSDDDDITMRDRNVNSVTQKEMHTESRFLGFRESIFNEL